MRALPLRRAVNSVTVAAPSKRVGNVDYLLQHGAHVVIAKRHAPYGPLCDSDAIHKTGSKQIALLSENDRATDTGNMDRKFPEVWTRRRANRDTDRHARFNASHPYQEGGRERGMRSNKSFNSM